MVKKTKGVCLFVFGTGCLSLNAESDFRASITLPLGGNWGSSAALKPEQGSELSFRPDLSKVVRMDSAKQKYVSRALVSGRKVANHEARKAQYPRVKVTRREIDDSDGNKAGKYQKKEKRSFVYPGNIDIQFMYKNPMNYLIPLDSRTGKLVHSKADKFFNILRSSGLEEALELLPSLPPNDVSYIIFKYRHLQKNQQSELFFDRVKTLPNLEFDWNQFEKLSEKVQECLLYNLAFPIKAAKFCLEDWEAGGYDMNNVPSYDSLSPVGLAWLFVLIQKHSSLKNYPELKGNQTYLKKVKQTLEVIRSDPRFPLERHCPDDFSDALDAVYRLYGN